jgi:hypothetical protein
MQEENLPQNFPARFDYESHYVIPNDSRLPLFQLPWIGPVLLLIFLTFASELVR